MTAPSRRTLPGFALLACLHICPAHAQDGASRALTIGVAAVPDSLDPQLRNRVPDFTLARHVFEPLVAQDRQQRLRPGLAVSWEPAGPTGWRFHLRGDVLFHDGSRLTADRVAAALRRPAALPPSAGGYLAYLRDITDITVEDPLTLVVHSAAAAPLMPTDLSTVLIVARADATTAAFDGGGAMVGTGPYRFVDWARGSRVMLRANESYWGVRPRFATVAFRAIPDGSARVAALLSGDVDLIDSVPSASVAPLREREGIALVRETSNRVLFLQVDSARETTPLARGADGAALPANPLRDARVRRALSLGIDRATVARVLLEDAAIPAGQILPQSYPGASQALPPVPFDPAAARLLLAAAGYPNGFAVTLTGPLDRYPDDRRIGEAVAQSLARIGVRVAFEALPASVVLRRLERGEVSALLWGWSSETGEPSGPLRAMVATPDAVRGWGATNRLRYSNSELDALLARALVTEADGARDDLLRRATEVAVTDGGVIPIVFLRLSWAARRPLVYRPNTVGWTFAWDAEPE